MFSLYHFLNAANYIGGSNDASLVEALTIDEIIEFYCRLIKPSSPERSKLAVYLTAQTGAKAITATEAHDARIVWDDVEDVMDFKSEMPLAPDQKPVKDTSEFW